MNQNANLTNKFSPNNLSVLLKLSFLRNIKNRFLYWWCMQMDAIDYRQFDQLDIIARQVVEGFIIGLHKSPYHGFSVEFSEYRNFNSGDSVRDVDWKAYAKTGKMYVKKFEEETNLRCQVVIDISTSMRYPKELGENALNKLEFSAIAAQAIFHILKKQRDAAGLTLVSNEIEVHTPTRTNTAHHKLLGSHLYHLLKDKTSVLGTDLPSCLHQVAELVHKRSMIFIFSDFLEKPNQIDSIFKAIQHLKHNKHEVVVFHVHHRSDEMEFKFENRPYKFIDMESGEEVKLLPAEVKDFYLQKIQEFHQTVKSKFIQYGIDWVDADIENGFKDILQAYFIKRKNMRI